MDGTANPASRPVSREFAERVARSGPRPELLEADPDALLDALEYLNGPRADDNRDRWSSWLPVFSASFGADHPRTSYARLEVARWLAQTGDLAGGLRQERALDDLRVRRACSA
jgi:hypothetical protein